MTIEIVKLTVYTVLQNGIVIGTFDDRDSAETLVENLQCSSARYMQ